MIYLEELVFLIDWSLWISITSTLLGLGMAWEAKTAADNSSAKVITELNKIRRAQKDTFKPKVDPDSDPF